MGKVKPGDGSELRPVKGLQWIWRGQFETEVDGHTYAVDVDYLDWDEKSRLYRDGTQVEVSGNPARFELAPDAQIEAKMTLYGMSRAHVVTPDGDRQMQPSPGTAERWRADLHRDHPRASIVIGVVSFAVLALALVIEVPQLLELWSRSDWWATMTDWRPTAPVSLSPPANLALTLAGVVAGLERALRLKHNWVLDE